MSIKHTKVSGKVDGADATLVQPSDWNGSHTIDDGTIVAVKLAVASNQRAFGRDTAGAGNGEEISAGQIFDWVSNTNGVLLTRTAGTWGAAAHAGIDGQGDLVLKTSATPATPSSTDIAIANQNVGGRQLAAVRAANGAPMVVQPLMYQKRLQWILPQAGANGTSASGMNTPSVTGTQTARAFASTNLATSISKIGYVSAAGANSVAGIRNAAASIWRGNAAGLGGFFLSCRFVISDAVLVSTANTFVGLMASTAAQTDVDPATLTNLFGIGCTNGDTVLQLYAAGAAAQARASLGVNFPVNTVNTDVYELIMFAYPNAASINYQVTRLNTGNVASGNVSVSANLFSTTTFVCQQAWRSNGGTASAVGIDLVSMFTESDV